VYIRCKRQGYVGPRGLVSPSKSIFSDLGLCLGSLGLKLNMAEDSAYEDFIIVSVKISSLD